MSDLFEQFPPVSATEWSELIIKELKGADLSILQKHSEIEGVTLPAYLHPDTHSERSSDPGKFPFIRGNKTQGNEWKTGSVFFLSKDGNGEILTALMSGTESILLVDDGDAVPEFHQLLSDVQLDYISISFQTESHVNAFLFLEYTGGKNVRVITENTNEWITKAAGFASEICQPFCINASSVTAAGGNTSQEVGIALLEGHDLLARLTEAGLSAEKAAHGIGFLLGTGATYFFEIAKIRAFRGGWTTILSQYLTEPLPEHLHISASTGFREMSAQDPYTNLLRQTTQALAAALGGVDELYIWPYDSYFSTPQLSFSRRMATNISLLMKEESFLDKVADAGGGSYLIETLTREILGKSWQIFLAGEEDQFGEKTRSRLVSELNYTRSVRIRRLNEKQDKLIGINIFPNPQQTGLEWKPLPNAWNNLEALILEREYTQA